VTNVLRAGMLVVLIHVPQRDCTNTTVETSNDAVTTKLNVITTTDTITTDVVDTTELPSTTLDLKVS